MKKVAILISAHKPIPYIEMIARGNPDLIFYLHLDLKVNIDLFSKEIENLIYIENRLDVKWGGFSQVQATLNLFKAALQDSKAEFFHFISGEDVALCNNQSLIPHLSWDNDQIYMHMVQSKAHQYRVRFVAPHVEKKWQRSISGKALTFFLKILDKIFPTNKTTWFGSSWFSIRRQEIEKIFENISFEDIEYFKKRLNPDEHFFQNMVHKSGLTSQISREGNKRFIVFDKQYHNGNNPIYQSVGTLINMCKEKNFFFARKVDFENQILFYEEVNK